MVCDVALECRKRVRLHRTHEWRRRGSQDPALPSPRFPSKFQSDGQPSAFFHKKSFTGNGEPHTGQTVSFVFEEGSKGAAAVNVREEEGGIALEQDVEEEEEREMGKVKVCKRFPRHHLRSYHGQVDHG